MKKRKLKSENLILPNLDEIEEEVVKPIKPNEKFYVDPTEFARLIKIYYNDKKITNELGDMVLKIASRLAYAPNFINYSYRSDMIGDAILKMIAALKNQKFDPQKGNPFSYMSKIAFNAFCNRIKREKRSSDTLSRYQDEVFILMKENGLDIDTENHDSQDNTIIPDNDQV
jgi:DNA-directed RNA polymerase specialized sigma24 family protein